jgi:hypothetical protein
MDISAANNTWVERMARMGLTAKGVVYLLLGLLAFMAAFEMGGQSNDDTDSNGVLLFIRDWPGGTWFLGLLILGLLSYSAWRVAEAISMRKKKLGEWRKPVRYFFSAFTYLTLAFAAVQMLLFKYTDDDGRHWSGEFINSGMGKLFIILVALLFAGNGAYQVWYGLSSKYKDHFDGVRINQQATRLLIKSGKVGYTARGVVLLIIAFMLGKAVVRTRSSDAGDTAEAFSFIESTSYGSYLLGALGLGLIAYGVFNFLRAAYERFD